MNILIKKKEIFKIFTKLNLSYEKFKQLLKTNLQKRVCQNLVIVIVDSTLAIASCMLTKTIDQYLDIVNIFSIKNLIFCLNKFFLSFKTQS